MIQATAIVAHDQAPPPVIVQDDPTSFLAVIKNAAQDPNCDTGKMEALLKMHKQLVADQAETNFNRDYMAAKMEMPRVRRDGQVEYAEDKNKPDGPKKKAFKFARYEDIDKAIRPIEQKYGFSRIFTTGPRPEAGGGIVVYCTLLHKYGHSKNTEIPVALDTSGGKNNIQAMGSSFSYGKRYTTEMVWDIVKEGEDDDGQGYDIVPIDEAQFVEIQRLIEESDTDTAKFCGHLKVESLKAITNKIYPKAIQDLNSKIEANKKKGAK